MDLAAAGRVPELAFRPAGRCAIIKDRLRLEAFLARNRRRLVDYRDWDCARYAAAWLADSGHPVSLPYWSNKFGALRAIRRNGYRLADLMDDYAGTPTDPARAPWGAIVALPSPPVDALGIADGSFAIFLAPGGGYTRRPLRACSHAWVI